MYQVNSTKDIAQVFKKHLEHGHFVNDKTGVFVEGRYTRPFDNEANDQFVNHASLLAGLKVDL